MYTLLEQNYVMNIILRNAISDCYPGNVYLHTDMSIFYILSLHQILIHYGKYTFTNKGSFSLQVTPFIRSFYARSLKLSVAVSV